MQVTIGVDPHKASHTAVAISAAEDELASKRVRATRAQVDQLLAWAAPSSSKLAKTARSVRRLREGRSRATASDVSNMALHYMPFEQASTTAPCWSVTFGTGKIPV